MKQLILFVAVGALLIVLLAILPGCRKVYPHGPDVRETRYVADFNKIDAAANFNIRYVAGSKKVEVEAAENIQKYIIAETTGNTLVLKVKPHVNIMRGDATIYVSAPELTGVTLSGNGDFTSYDAINAQTMSLKVTGNGNVLIPQLTTEALDVIISGNGNITIQAGTAQNQDVSVRGNGDYFTDQMHSNYAKIRLTGSGNAKVWVNNQLDVTITGSGGVRYAGNPSVNASVTGSGKVMRL